MDTKSVRSSRSTGQVCRDLIRISRFDQYNSCLALFAGGELDRLVYLNNTGSDYSLVWSVLLSASLRIKESNDIELRFILVRMAFCCLAAYIYSGAGMVWNDWVDRDIDAKVARTKNRPLPAGRLYTGEAMAWMVLQAAIATCMLHFMMDGQHV